jgi:Tol biopolymer transport system component/DNA-binding winged helix-turn-helix (wHTH) protein
MSHVATLTSPSLQFGPFRLDRDTRHLWRDGQPLHLTPKVFDILSLLASHPGQVLAKEEIMQAVWPDRHVEEANLTQSISMLRKALGESDSGVKYIATFPGKGYQFVATVQDLAPVSPASPAVEAVPATKTPGRSRWWWVLATLPLFGVLIWKSGRNEAGTTGFASRQRPLSRLPGGEYHPAISRSDGKVAFVWDGDGAHPPAIFVRAFDDDEPRQLTQDPQVAYSSPAWSPDGHHVAALRQESTALKLVVIPARGGTEREVTSLFPTRYGMPGRHLDWSPDGQSIVVDDKSASHEPFHLVLVNAQTGERRQIARSEPAIIGDTDPRFSPDGQQLSFVRQRSRLEHDLYTVPLTGGNPQRRTRDQRSIGGHDWSADGQWLVWNSNRDEQHRLWRLPSDGRQALPQMLPTITSGAHPIQFAISRSTGHMVYAEFWQDLNIWSFDTHPSAASRWKRVVASTSEDSMPQISPDGQRLCFQSSRSGNIELWLSAADGSNPRQLTRDAQQPSIGRWSPDGASIIYFSIGTRIMYQVDPSGGLPKALGPPGTQGIHPVLMRDGQLLFTLNNDLLTMPLAGSVAPRPLLRNISFYRIPSPDAQHLYFAEGRTEPGISRVTLATGERQKLVHDLLPGYWGAWAVGRRGLYYLRAFATSPPTTAHIAFYDFSTGAVTNLAPFAGSLPPLGTTAWSLSPDERLLYVVRSDNSQSDVMLVEPPR